MITADSLKQEYMDWMNKQIKIHDNEDFIEIQTPFVDMHHDYISLIFTKLNNSFKLSDDGYIIDELDQMGVSLNQKGKRYDFFEMTLKTFGINFSKSTGELYVEFKSLREFPERQHRLIQCILKVIDMLLTTREKTISFFTEDIENFFIENNVLYNEGPSYMGKSSVSQVFDFALPKSKKSYPKLIKAVNKPSAQSYKDPLFSFIDIQDFKSDHEFLVLANDTETKISDKFIEPFNNYNIKVLRWTDRKNWVDNLKVI
ncbi:DUF1828 domain-containing protein [Terribacillus saccharophilus]|uniref:DUF1828 domain-containing protein n=1 Tax=Terribacillus saccharophilus TaxID=361277 RepID=UPI0015CEF53E|nr:DUF1828 domain-containing protein [Terribacillus saccharophilus]